VEPSWEEFVSSHAQAVMNAALRVVGNISDAEDVAQNVFIEIFRNGNIVELEDQPALLCTIATRRALDLLRRRKLPHELNGYELDLCEHEPCDYAIAAELEERLGEGLGRLPPREAEVFCLTFFEGYSNAEIAKSLNISPGAVAKSLCIARSRLSKFFGNVKTEPKP